MKKTLPFLFVWFIASHHAAAQTSIRYNINGQSHFCTSMDPQPYFHVNSGNLQLENPGSSTCDIWTVLQLNVSNFTGTGTYSFDYGNGNYGYYNNDTVPPSWSTPNYTGDPGGGSITVLQYDSVLGILEGTFNMVVSKHMLDTSDHTTISITDGYFKYGGCSLIFNLVPDTVPHHWWLYYHLQGVTYPVTLSFNWGDGTGNTANSAHIYSGPGNYNICLTVTDNEGCISTYCDTSTYIYKTGNMLSVDALDPSVTGIQPAIIHPQFEIFPNPASDNVTVTTDAAQIGKTITLTDIRGREVHQSAINNPQSAINCSALSNGIYFLTLGSATKKLVISR